MSLRQRRRGEPKELVSQGEGDIFFHAAVCGGGEENETLSARREGGGGEIDPAGPRKEEREHLRGTGTTVLSSRGGKTAATPGWERERRCPSRFFFLEKASAIIIGRQKEDGIGPTEVLPLRVKREKNARSSYHP